LFFTAPVELLPKAVLGAVIVMAAIALVDRKEWRALAVAGRMEVVIASVTMFGVVVVGVLWGLAVAVVLSILHATSRSARPHDAVLGWVARLGRYADVSTHTSAQVTPGIVVYRLDDRLFFANVNYVRARILEALDGAKTSTQWLVFDAEGVSTIDSSGTEMLQQLAGQLQQRPISLAMARAKQPVLDTLDAAGLVDLIRSANFYPNVESAVNSCAERIPQGP